MDPLTQADLQALPVPTLVARMDEILRLSEIERYGQLKLAPISLVGEVLACRRVSQLSEEWQRKVAYVAFSYLVELAFNSVTGGIANRELYNDSYDQHRSWTSPLFRLRDGALRQFGIVSSRIAMDVFMDLLFCIQTGRLIDAPRSKFRAFRKWLLDVDNEFHYFAHVLLAAWYFDRNIRTPEVHGTSKLARDVLLLQVPNNDQLGESLILTNLLMGCWRPLIDILSERRPNYMQLAGYDKRDWFDAYVEGSKQRVQEMLGRMLAELV